MRLFPKDIIAKAKEGRLVMITAYDVTFARMAEDAGVDMILVGDSLGMVVQGHENTIPVTCEDIIYHCRCVARGSKKSMIVADMPFLSYQISPSQAVLSAGRIMKEGGAQAVKMEGGMEMVGAVKAVTSVGIPVMAHLGICPQAVYQQGGYRIQGKTDKSAKRLFNSAHAMVEAGAFSLLLEGIEPSVTKKISESVGVPTVGIASGPHCTGQVLVIYDVLGFNPEFKPSFLKTYLDGYEKITQSVREYAHEVRAGKFPK